MKTSWVAGSKRHGWPDGCVFCKLLFAAITVPLLLSADIDNKLSVAGLINGGLGVDINYDLDDKSRLSAGILAQGHKHQDTLEIGVGYIAVLEQGAKYEVYAEPSFSIGYIKTDGGGNSTYLSPGVGLGVEYYLAPKKFSLGMLLSASANFGDLDEYAAGSVGAYARYHF